MLRAILSLPRTSTFTLRGISNVNLQQQANTGAIDCFVYPKNPYVEAEPLLDGFRRVEHQINEISAIYKRDDGEFPSLLCPVRTLQKMIACEPGSGHPRDSTPAHTMILDFSAFRMHENKHLLL